MIGNRNERLALDYHEMLKIQDRPYLSWIATKGELPYAEEYLLTIKLRTYVLSVDSGVHTVGAIHCCVVRVMLWDSYPNIAPNVRMLNIPPVFAPDWYSKGTYCPSEPWCAELSLKDFILRMLRTLQNDPTLIHTDAPANYKALDWYLKNRDNSSLFPSDRTPLTENTGAELASVERSAVPFVEAIDSWSAR